MDVWGLSDGSGVVSKIDEAVAVLAALGLPRSQQNERSALTLLALAKLGPRRLDQSAASVAANRGHHGIHAGEYGKDYKPNTRETIRRQTIHQFEQARLVDRNPDEPERPTNSGKNAYRLTEEVAEVLKAFGTTVRQGGHHLHRAIRHAQGCLRAATGLAPNPAPAA